MSDVFFPLYGGLSMLIRESDMKNICQPDKLAALAGCVSVPMMKDCMPAADISDHFDSESGKEIFIFRQRYGQLYYLPETRCFRFLPNTDTLLSARLIVFIWRLCVLAAAYSSVLNKKNVMILHGAALKIHNQVLLLCGQSGMGKSTASSRWKACGCGVLCDDMMLLEQTPGGVVVHPLPTWSRCMSSLDGENVNFSETYTIRAVIALNRSRTGVETLEKADKIFYYSTIYSSCCAFLSLFVKQMPEEEQKELRGAAISWADLLSSGEKYVLYADLNGNLKDTLKIFQ